MLIDFRPQGLPHCDPGDPINNTCVTVHLWPRIARHGGEPTEDGPWEKSKDAGKAKDEGKSKDGKQNGDKAAEKGRKAGETSGDRGVRYRRSRVPGGPRRAGAEIRRLSRTTTSSSAAPTRTSCKSCNSNSSSCRPTSRRSRRTPRCGVRGARHLGQGRLHLTYPGADQSAPFALRRALEAHRSRTRAMVFSALHQPLADQGRFRSVRPELVQSRRRRARDGLLHRGAGGSAFCATHPSSRRCWCATTSTSSRST